MAAFYSKREETSGELPFHVGQQNDIKTDQLYCFTIKSY